VSIPLLGALLLLSCLPTFELQLRLTGFWFEAVALFIIGLRLWTVRTFFKAPTWCQIVKSWWAARPKRKRSVIVNAGGVQAVALAASMSGTGFAGGATPPPDDAPDKEKLRYLLRAVLALQRAVDTGMDSINERVGELSKEFKQTAEDLDKKREADAREVKLGLREIGAGNVQREQWAVFLLFLGAVLLIAG